MVDAVSLSGCKSIAWGLNMHHQVTLSQEKEEEEEEEEKEEEKEEEEEEEGGEG